MLATRRLVIPLAALALLICYASTLRGMADQWTHDEDMAHGFVVPVVILWIIWRERDRWRTLPAKSSLWGYVILAAAASLDFAGALGVGLFARSLAFLLSIVGAIVCLKGFAWLRAWMFPFVLALFMLPKLAIAYNQVTLPLQLLATRLAATMLTTAGFDVIRSGNILSVAGHSIAVVEACDGIRYLIPLVFTALVLGYLAGSKPWMRVALAITACPVAILANGFRLAASAPVPALTAEPMHSVAGWLIFLACLMGLVLLHRLIRAVYTRYA